MKYKIVYAIDADAEDVDEFLSNLSELADIHQEEIEDYANGYNQDAGGEEDIDVWVTCEQISEKEYDKLTH